MKKSLLITNYFPPYTGGISNSLFNFCNNLPNEKIVVLTDKKFQKESNFKVITKKLFSKCKFIWPKWLPLIHHAIKTVKKEGIELIQVGQVIPIGYVALLIKKMLKVPYIVYIYGQDLIITRQSLRKSRLLVKVLNNSDGIIANSIFTKNLAQDLGIKKEIIVAYPCPQKMDLNVDQYKLMSFKKDHNLSNKKIILTVGNLVKRKGQDNVIRAINELRKGSNDYHYLIVGNGPNQRFLEDLVNQFNLSDNVSFHHHVSDKELKYYYSACDVFIMAARILINDQNLPVDVEGFGMVFLEANLYKKPVVAGMNGGQIDAVEEGKSGLLVNATKINEIVSAIEKLANDGGLANNLGEYGYHRVITEFTWKNQTKKIIDFIETLA